MTPRNEKSAKPSPNERVARIDQRRKIGESEIAQRAVARVQVKQAAGGALRGGVLGDELGRQLIIKLGNEHPAPL